MADRGLASFVRARLKEKSAEAALNHARSGAEEEQGPAGRLIAEAKASYEIVNLCDRFLAQQRPDPAGADLARQTLHFLAIPYRAHPDFREEWQS